MFMHNARVFRKFELCHASPPRADRAKCNRACLQDHFSNTLLKPHVAAPEMEFIDQKFQYVVELLNDYHQRLRAFENREADYDHRLRTLEIREDIFMKQIAACQQDIGQRKLETHYVKEQVDSMVKNASPTADGKGYVLSSLDRVFGTKENN